MNAEGKCRCKAAMQAVLRAAWDLDCRAKIIVVAECDYRRSLDEETYDFWYRRTCWVVTRHKLDHGRAMKVFIAKEIENNITAITWMRRSVVLRCHSDRDDFSLICSHFAHNDDWEPSLFEVVDYIAGAPGLVFLVGDLNCESRTLFQSPEQRARWELLCGALQSQGLVQRDVGIEYSRRAKSDSENHSLIDHVFVSSAAVGRCGATWEGAPGDHCWLMWETPFRTEWRKQQPRRWRCDWDSFTQYLSSETPDIFGTWDTAEKWIADTVQSFSLKSSRRERRRNWEPLRIKTLRARIRTTVDESARSDLSRRLFKLRKEWALEREKAQLRGDLSKGKNPGKKRGNLFPVIELENDDGVTRQRDELKRIVEDEFSSGWRGPAGCNFPEDLRASLPITGFDIDVDELRECAKRLKRPWMMDS